MKYDMDKFTSKALHIPSLYTQFCFPVFELAEKKIVKWVIEVCCQKKFVVIESLLSKNVCCQKKFIVKKSLL